MQNEPVNERIKQLKEQENAVILAHNYQVQEVQAIADHVGDSLELSQLAASTNRDTIVFAGVKFMAETAKILSPTKRVLLPRLDAGCPMADMITVDDLRQMKSDHPGAKVVTYVNSTVEIKAESDICCTSANAVNMVQSVASDEVIFLPDQNLGSYIQKQVPEKKIIVPEGYCYVHNRIKEWEVAEMKKQHPHAIVVAHPEVRPEVIELADEVCSTSGMIRFARSSPGSEFIVLTEEGLLERLRKENPGKHFYPAYRPKICSNMKKTSVQDVADSLLRGQYEITIAASLQRRARKALEAMIQLS